MKRLRDSEIRRLIHSYPNHALAYALVELLASRKAISALREGLGIIIEFSKVKDDRCGHQHFADKCLSQADKIIRGDG